MDLSKGEVMSSKFGGRVAAAIAVLVIAAIANLALASPAVAGVEQTYGQRYTHVQTLKKEIKTVALGEDMPASTVKTREYSRKYTTTFRGWDRRSSAGIAVVYLRHEDGQGTQAVTYNPTVLRPFRGYAVDRIYCGQIVWDRYGNAGAVCNLTRHYKRTGKSKWLASQHVGSVFRRLHIDSWKGAGISSPLFLLRHIHCSLFTYGMLYIIIAKFTFHYMREMWMYHPEKHPIRKL